MAANVFVEAVRSAGGTREDGAVLEIAFDVRGKFRGRAIAAVAITLESFHGDPIEIAAEKRDELGGFEPATLSAVDGFLAIGINLGARAGRVLFAKDAEELIEWLFFQLLRVEGKRGGEQFVEKDAKGVHIGAGIDVSNAGIDLFWAHITGSSEQDTSLSEDSGVGFGRNGGLGDAEVDDARTWLAIDLNDENVGGLEVAVNDGFLVRVLDGFTDLNKEAKTIGKRQFFLVAIASDGKALNVFHDEVGLAAWSGASIENLGNARMIHDGERLAFRLEALKSDGVEHAGANELQGYLAANRKGLFGKPDLTHATFTKNFEQAVRANGLEGCG
jgi:hypothetical protein